MEPLEYAGFIAVPTEMPFCWRNNGKNIYIWAKEDIFGGFLTEGEEQCHIQWQNHALFSHFSCYWGQKCDNVILVIPKQSFTLNSWVLVKINAFFGTESKIILIFPLHCPNRSKQVCNDAQNIHPPYQYRLLFVFPYSLQFILLIYVSTIMKWLKMLNVVQICFTGSVTSSS